MGLLNRFTSQESRAKNDLAGDFVDLAEYATEGPAGAATWVRVAELAKYDELRNFLSTVYEGNILILDFSALKNDEIAMRRLTSDLKKLAADVSGDIAGLGESTLIVTPTGVKVDRRKLRAEI